MFVAWPTGVQLLVFFCSSVPLVLFDTPGISRCRSQHVPVESSSLLHHHVGRFETYRYKRTGQFFYMELYRKLVNFFKYLDNYCRYQYCANDTLFRNISCILRSIFQDILPKKKKKDVAFCEKIDTAHSYIKQMVNFSEINVSIDA